jgi:hypothetical protein
MVSPVDDQTAMFLGAVLQPCNLSSCGFFLLSSFGAPGGDEPVEQLPVDLDDVRRPLRRKLGWDPVQQQREDHVAVSTKQFPPTTQTPQFPLFVQLFLQPPIIIVIILIDCKSPLVFAGGYPASAFRAR